MADRPAEPAIVIVLVAFAALDLGAVVRADNHDHLDDLVRRLIRHAGGAATIETIPEAAAGFLAAPFETLLPLDLLRIVIADAVRSVQG